MAFGDKFLTLQEPNAARMRKKARLAYGFSLGISVLALILFVLVLIDLVVNDHRNGSNRYMIIVLLVLVVQSLSFLAREAYYREALEERVLALEAKR